MENLQIGNITIGMTEEELKEFSKIEKAFLESYYDNKDKMTLEEWLNNELQKYLPQKTIEELEKFTDDILETLEWNERNEKSLEKAVESGSSKEIWFANELKHSLKDLSNHKIIEYLDNLDGAIKECNEAMYQTVVTKAGAINKNFNLDGFIAEQKHVSSFNLNATAKKSNFIAEVLVQKEGQTYGKNSVDIVIKDKAGKIVQRYQSKYGKTAKDTIKLLKDGNYNNQRFLVPKEQVSEVQKAFPNKSVQAELSIENVKSDGFTKAEMKNLQKEVQDGNIRGEDWNSFQTKQIAVEIAQGAAYAGIQGMVIGAAGEVITKFLRGEEIKANAVIENAFKTGETMGINAAVTGALKVAIERNLIKIIPAGTPASVLSNIVYLGIENTKILYKIVKGELTIEEGMEKIEETTTIIVSGMVISTEGAMIGGSIGVVFGPIGMAIGGVVGGIVGYFIGSKIGEVMTKVNKSIKNAARKIVETTESKINIGENMVKNSFTKIQSKIKTYLIV